MSSLVICCIGTSGDERPCARFSARECRVDGPHDGRDLGAVCGTLDAQGEPQRLAGERVLDASLRTSLLTDPFAMTRLPALGCVVRVQEKLSSTAPPGWSIELADMSFGTDAPKMANYRVGALHGGEGSCSPLTGVQGFRV